MSISSRILLITPRFYGVENKIKSSLEESGNTVIWIENKNLLLDYHGTNSKCEILRRLLFFLFSPQKRFVKKQLQIIEEHSFDILFSINAHIICSFLIKYLKKQNPRLYSVLFLWDSFSMYQWTNELKYFDRVLTFDLEDSKTFNVEYKPNFFIKKDNQKNNFIEDYDLFFAGKFNPSRLFMLDKILNQTEKSGIKYFIKLWPAYRIFFHNKILYKFLKIFIFKSTWTLKYILNFEAIEGILKREYMMTNSLSYDDMNDYFMNSNVILDIPFQQQTGYSHCIIEALAIGKKIITTNSYIKKESFFDSEQIKILDKNNPEIDCKWINEKSTFEVSDYFSELELSTWLKSVINVEIA